MELIIIIIAIIASVVMSLIMRTKTEELKNIALDEKLNSISKKFPSNTEICKTILIQLGNETTKAEEDLKSEATIYVAIQDKISVGNTHESFTRIQTMAHECLHSVQDKKLLMFNFIYSNIYLLYFIITTILALFNKLNDTMLYISIMILLSYIYYFVRSYLENDAMIKARYVAKEYMEEIKISSHDEIANIIKSYDKLNDIGIKTVNYQLMLETLIKVIILAIAFLI